MTENAIREEFNKNAPCFTEQEIEYQVRAIFAKMDHGKSEQEKDRLWEIQKKCERECDLDRFRAFLS